MKMSLEIELCRQSVACAKACTFWCHGRIQNFTGDLKIFYGEGEQVNTYALNTQRIPYFKKRGLVKELCHFDVYNLVYSFRRSVCTIIIIHT
jgi:hypothetical protein